MAYTSTHWGVYEAKNTGGTVELTPAPWDRDPSPLSRSLTSGRDAPARIRRPAIRAGFLKSGAASREGRGREPFVEVPWDEAFDITAHHIARVREQYGNESFYGGSYGWSSAGRFHHAQSQFNRFFRLTGGYVDSVDSYSLAAARVILPHVVAPWGELSQGHTDWNNLAEHTDLFIAFGGLPAKNTQVNPGGASDHVVREALRRMAAGKTQFVNVSPSRSDLTDAEGCEWLPIRPGSDTALMLALAYVLIAEDLHDQAFIESHSVGFEHLRDYLFGAADNQHKTPAWAAPLCDIPADTITALARRMAKGRTMINVAWSLQRAENGELPYWMAVNLAVLLGQIGLPGGGFGVGYACMQSVGSGRFPFSGPRLPQGTNPVTTFIPVARVSDMLLNPGGSFTYDGGSFTYPDIKLVYWCGGNIFHHHQDLNKLIEAWRRPEVTIINESFWTPHAKFSDIVLPATTTLERNDIGSASLDRFMVAMKRVADPVGEARDDYDIFSGIAERLGFAEQLREGRTAEQWLEVLYEECRPRAEVFGITLPPFEQFWEEGLFDLPAPEQDTIMLESFRKDPEDFALNTPSGLIEMTSTKIAGFHLPDFPGTPEWREPREWLGAPRAQTYPLHLLSNQPSTRLHSQYDHGVVSRESKINGREPLTMNIADASARGLAHGDVVRVFNDRGAFLAGLVVSDAIRPGVVQIATGAWYDPLVAGEIGTLDKHGNPNAVTQDVGASSLSQGCAAQSALVQVERFNGELPPITAFQPPQFVAKEP